MSTSLAGLRICLVGPHYPRPGGISTQVELLTRLLRAEGAMVRGADTNVQAARRLGRWLVPPAQLLALPWRLLRASQGADLIHVHLASHWAFHLPIVASLAVAQLRGIPLVATFHGGGAPEFVARYGPWVRAALRRVDALVVLSAWSAEIFARLGLRPVIIPNVVALDSFKPAGGDGRQPGRDPALLWIKYFAPYGNPELMLRALAHLRRDLPDARLTMVGQGELLPAMQALAAELDLPVTFVGRVPFADMPGLYARSDIFVNTSTVDNQPCTVLEAAASGLPVVATAVGGVPSMIRDGVDGLLVPSDDVGALAGALLRLWREPGLAERLSAGGLVNAQHYAWPAVGARLAALYRQVIGQGER